MMLSLRAVFAVMQLMRWGWARIGAVRRARGKLLGFCAAALLAGCQTPATLPPDKTAEQPKPVPYWPALARFSPDERHLLVTMCRLGDLWYCQLWRYWIAEDRWERMALERERSYLWAEYSPDGKTIVLSTMPCPRRECRLEDARLALMDADGANLRLLPGDERPRWGASFSRDGKRLIYWGLVGIVQLPRRPVAVQSIYERDLDSGTERRLTPLGFPAPVGMPRYWWDERRFMVALADPPAGAATGHTPSGYAIRYREHFVWAFEPGAREWMPAFDSPGDASMGFDMSADRRLLYVAHAPQTSRLGALHVRGVEPLSEPTMVLWRPAGLGFYDAAFSISGKRAVAIPRSFFMDVKSINRVELWLIDLDTLETKQVQYANPQTMD